MGVACAAAATVAGCGGDGDSTEAAGCTQVAEHATFGAWSTGGDGVYYFADNGDGPGAQWRLARGRIEGDTLVRDGYVGDVTDYLYGYFGLDAGPCAPAG